MAGQIIESLDENGKLHLSNIISVHTGLFITYSETDEISSDVECLGDIYRKYKGKYIKLNYSLPFNIDEAGARYNGLGSAINKAIKAGINDVMLGDSFVYEITSTIEIPAYFKLTGLGSTNVNDISPTSYILKIGDFDGIRMIGKNSELQDLHIQGAIGNGGRGIVQVASRCSLNNVSTAGHGSDGIRIGEGLLNCNLWRMNRIYSINNGGWGVYISSGIEHSSADCNTGTWTLADIRNNTLGGLKMGKAHDNNLYGVSCQTNLGPGIQVEARGNNFYGCYTESNDEAYAIANGADARRDVWFTSTSLRNSIQGYRSAESNDRVFNEGTSNYVLGWSSALSTPYVRSALGFSEIILRNTAISGSWRFKQNANRNIELTLFGTGSSASVSIYKEGDLTSSADLYVDGSILLGKEGNSYKALCFGSGTPETFISSRPGAIYINKTATGLTDLLYFKSANTGPTGWLPFPLVAAVLSLDSTFGGLKIGTGTVVNLTSLSRGASNTYGDSTLIPLAGFVAHTIATGSTGYPDSTGGGVKYARVSNSGLGFFEFFKGSTSSTNLYYRVGTGATTLTEWYSIPKKAAALTATAPIAVTQTSTAAGATYNQADIQKMVTDITNLTAQLNALRLYVADIVAKQQASGILT